MSWPSASIGKVAGRLVLAGGGGGAGLLGLLATIRNPGTTLAIAVVFAAALISNAIAKVTDSIYRHRPEIIKELGEREANLVAAQSNAMVQIIRATSEADALMQRTYVRRELLEAGILPGGSDRVIELLRQQPIDADLPEDRRLDNEALAKLLAAPKPTATSRHPGNGPRGGATHQNSRYQPPQRGRPSRPGGVVVPMRRADDDPAGPDHWTGRRRPGWVAPRVQD